MTVRKIVAALLLLAASAGDATAQKADRKAMELDMLRALEMASAKAGELDALRDWCRRSPGDAGLARLRKAVKGVRTADAADIQERAYRYGRSLRVEEDCGAAGIKSVQDSLERNLARFSGLRKKLGG